MRINRIAIWLGIVVVAFSVGWMAYKTLPLKMDVAESQEVTSRVDTASWGGFNRVADHLNLQGDQRVLFHERERIYRDSLYYYRQLLNDLESRIVRA
ncbi:MAG: hypothetical protein LC643_08400, partial [Bacteroidales bacterium]|nr:hypothetical protein [Bacteroidales bacterium]